MWGMRKALSTERSVEDHGVGELIDLGSDYRRQQASCALDTQPTTKGARMRTWVSVVKGF
tara:strand:+ start:9520 stop:9699 length:180 start_codon:yes stop_codon:yes gene_type:complete